MMVIKVKGAHAEARLDQFCMQMITVLLLSLHVWAKNWTKTNCLSSINCCKIINSQKQSGFLTHLICLLYWTFCRQHDSRSNKDVAAKKAKLETAAPKTINKPLLTRQ